MCFMVANAVARALLFSTAFCLFTDPTHAVLLRAGSAHRLPESAEPSPAKSTHDILSSESAAPKTSVEGFVAQAPPVNPVPPAPVHVPSMFVAIMTKRETSVLNRNAIRDLWHSVSSNTGQFCYRFSVCKGEDTHQQGLVAEQTAYGDLMFLDCEEGYAKGLLTKKVIATIEAYRHAATSADAFCLDRELFMKTDDDTFVSGHRFRSELSAAAAKDGTSHMFAGVYAPMAPVIRNTTSHWFEPVENWGLDLYPASMLGGPGYIIGKSLVQLMVDANIPHNRLLWNEDKAVGVWINDLHEQGILINWTHLPGTNGFAWDYPIQNGTWGAYPYALHHHISRACIACMAMFDRANSPNVQIQSCFQLDPLPAKWKWW